MGEDEFSFHQPADLVQDSLLESIDVDDSREGEHIDYTGESRVYDIDWELDEALRTIDGYGIDPNDYLEVEEIEEYDSGAVFPTVFYYEESDS